MTPMIITPDKARELVARTSEIIDQTRELYYRAHGQLALLDNLSPAERAHHQRLRDALFAALVAMSQSETVLREALKPTSSTALSDER